ncbi:hypothetical protein UFOVP235_30 [uncultured Caudovirales phage]|uniref:Uncharacterized protein n=1 Tax=uncultured Caudovirales phage TaxID=2100421 RepID=A0A6J7WZ58_9CAUD|nr:hypothetical protein UFOVP235_30 [uncultured Caudovirales phage]
MFAEILGLAGSAMGAFGSMQSANTAAKAAYYQAQVAEAARQQQMHFNQYLIGKSEDYYRDSTNRYNQGIDYFNADRSLRANESAFSKNLLNSDRLEKASEYSNVLDRQMQLDKDAARNRAFQLQEYLRAQNISGAERATAMQELKYAQAVASGERDQELQRFYEDRDKRQSERQFQMDELRRAQQIAAANRQIATDQRSRYDTGVNELRDVTRSAISNLGDIKAIPQMTSADISAEGDKRRALYERAIDRAANVASSQNEAALIRGGVDSSSTGAARRSEVAEKIAPLYEQAYQRASDDALKYMTGVQSTLFAGYDKDLARRAQVLNESRLPITAYLESLRAAPQIAGDLGVGPSFANVGSGVYDKKVTSANDYRSPLQVGSGFNAANLQLIGGDYGQNIMLQASGIGPRDFTSGVLGGMQSYVSNPQNPIAGISGLNFGYGQASANAASARDFAQNRSQDFGRTAGNFLSRLGSAADSSDWLKGLFGGGSNFDYVGYGDSQSTPSGGWGAWKSSNPWFESLTP